MDNKNQSRNIDPQKIRAENLNGKFALVGLIALVGAYITTGQIVPGIILFFSTNVFFEPASSDTGWFFC